MNTFCKRGKSMTIMNQLNVFLFILMALFHSAYAMERETIGKLIHLQSFVHGTLELDNELIIANPYKNFPFDMHEPLSTCRFVKREPSPDIKLACEEMNKKLLNLKNNKELPILWQNIIQDIVLRLTNLYTDNDLTSERLKKLKELYADADALKYDSNDVDHYVARHLQSLVDKHKQSMDDVWTSLVKEIKANRANYLAAWCTNDPITIRRAVEASASKPINLEQTLKRLF